MKLTLTADELLETVRNHMKREEQMELDSMYLTTLLDQLRQISEEIGDGTDELDALDVNIPLSLFSARTRLNQLRVRIGKDALALQAAEAAEDSEMPYGRIHAPARQD